MLDDLFNRLGATLGTLEAELRHRTGAADGPREVAVYDTDTGDVHDLDAEPPVTLESAALLAAGAWLLSRVLQPRDVSWPRVILAGIAATAIADLVGRTAAKPPYPEGRPFADDAEELLARFGAGVAIAAGYAALIHPRLPGPPLLRGALFGGLEILAAPRGGVLGIAASTPGVKFPLQALVMPVDEDAGPLSHLAFGLALGALYRYEAEE